MARDYRMALYEKAMPSELSWEERLAAARDAGYDSIEMSIDESDERLSRLNWNDKKIWELYELERKVGLPIESICFSCQRKYPLGSLKWEKEAKETLEKGILFAKKLGIRVIQTQGYDVYYEEEPSEETRKRFFENVKKGTMFAASHGVSLAFETMENDFMNTVEKAMKVVNYVNSPYLGVYPDIGNVTNSGVNVLKDLEIGKGHIFAAHLKETVPGKFREIPYGTGHVDFPADIAKLYEMGVRRYGAEFWYTGETDWFDICKNNRAFLDNQFDKAFELLK